MKSYLKNGPARCLICEEIPYYSFDWGKEVCKECKAILSRHNVGASNVKFKEYYISHELKKLFDDDVEFRKEFIGAKKQFLSLDWGEPCEDFCFCDWRVIVKYRLSEFIYFIFNNDILLAIFESDYQKLFNCVCPLEAKVF